MPKSRRNYQYFLQQIESAIDRVECPYVSKALGQIQNLPLMLYYPHEPFSTKFSKHILIMSGQHGEELAGPYSVLYLLQKYGSLFKDSGIAISIIPVANIHGFRTGDRTGVFGGVTNHFMKRDYTIKNDLSREARILYDNCDLIGELSADGILNMHEDDTSKGFYIYIMGNSKSSIIDNMKRAGRKFFNYKQSGEYHDNGTYLLKGALVDNHPDFTFDHYLVTHHNIAISVTTETPAHESIPFESRMHAGADMAANFITSIRDN